MAGTIAEVLSWVFIGTGSVFVIIGGVGMLRLPDFYTRIHAAGITDTMGSWLILVGLMFQSGWNLVTAKLVFLMFFMVATSPLASHALAKAAFLRDLKPLLGPELIRGDDHD